MRIISDRMDRSQYVLVENPTQTYPTYPQFTVHKKYADRQNDNMRNSMNLVYVFTKQDEVS